MSVRGYGALAQRLARLEASVPRLGVLCVTEDRQPGGTVYILPDGQQLTAKQLQDFVQRRRVGVLVIDDLPGKMTGQENERKVEDVR